MSQHISDMVRIVCFGGGSGLSELLKGLKMLRAYFITAIVTMFDNGGRSGEIRNWDALVLPVGDLRRCLEALSMRDPREFGMLGESFEGLPGKLTLFHLALYGAEKSFKRNEYERALNLLGHMYRVAGDVLPVSVHPSHLCASYVNGMEFKGEEFVDHYMNQFSGIERLWLEPQVMASPSVLEAIANADFLCFGPGSLYTSVLATLLPIGVRKAIVESDAESIVIANIMNEGDGMTGMVVDDHVGIIEEYSGRKADYVIVNTGRPSERIIRRYKKVERKEFLKVGPRLTGDPRCHFGPLWSLEGGRRRNDKLAIRHDPHKLAAMIYQITHP